jgi:hypothetical protein
LFVGGHEPPHARHGIDDLGIRRHIEEILPYVQGPPRISKSRRSAARHYFQPLGGDQ